MREQNKFQEIRDNDLKLKKIGNENQYLFKYENKKFDKLENKLKEINDLIKKDIAFTNSLKKWFYIYFIILYILYI